MASTTATGGTTIYTTVNSPDFQHVVSYKATRYDTSESSVTYEVEIKTTAGTYSGGKWTSNGLIASGWWAYKCTCKITGSNNVAQKKEVWIGNKKSATDYISWPSSSTPKTYTTKFSITVTSTNTNNLTMSLAFTPYLYGDAGTSSNAGYMAAKNYSVKVPALITPVKLKKPTYNSASPTLTSHMLVSENSSITLTATAPANATLNTVNQLTFYIKYSNTPLSSTAIDWTKCDKHSSVNVSASGKGSGKLTFSDFESIGRYAYLGVRAKGTGGSSYWSDVTYIGYVRINNKPSISSINISTTNKQYILPTTVSTSGTNTNITTYTPYTESKTFNMDLNFNILDADCDGEWGKFTLYYVTGSESMTLDQAKAATHTSIAASSAEVTYGPKQTTPSATSYFKIKNFAINDSDKQKIFFYISDGTNKSDYFFTTINFIYDSKLDLSNLGLNIVENINKTYSNSTNLSLKYTSSTTVTDSLNAIYTATGKNRSLECEYYVMPITSSTEKPSIDSGYLVSSSTISVTTNTTISGFSISSIINSTNTKIKAIKPGSLYKNIIKVTDTTTGESLVVYSNSAYYQLKTYTDLSSFSMTVVPAAGNGTDLSNYSGSQYYYNEYFKVTIVFPQNEEYFPFDTSKFSFSYITSGAESISFTQQTTNTSGNIYTAYINGSSLPRGQSVLVKGNLVSLAQTLVLESKFNGMNWSLQRVSPPSFGTASNNIYIYPYNIGKYTTNEVAIIKTGPLNTELGESFSSDLTGFTNLFNASSEKITAIIAGKSYDIKTYFSKTFSSEKEVSLSFNIVNFCKNFIQKSLDAKTYVDTIDNNVKITYSIEDFYGNEALFTQTITLDFLVDFSFAKNAASATNKTANFRVGLIYNNTTVYYPVNSAIDSYPNGTTSQDNILVNPGETLRLYFLEPSPSLTNTGKTISSYKLISKRTSLDGKTTKNVTYNLANKISAGSGYSYFDFVTKEDISAPFKFNFTLQAEYNSPSGIKTIEISSVQTLILSKLTSPIMDFESQDITSTSSNIKLNLVIYDIGGNSDYIKYPNFNRRRTDGVLDSNSATITLELDGVNTFDSNSKITLTTTKPITGTNGLLTSSYSQGDKNKTALTFTSSSAIDLSGKFVRVTLKIPYSNKVISTIYTLPGSLGEKPTLACRKNRVGINTQTVPEDTLLFIQSLGDSKERRYIQFNGILSDNVLSNVIIFDAFTGETGGLVLSGGSW